MNVIMLALMKRDERDFGSEATRGGRATIDVSQNIMLFVLHD